MKIIAFADSHRNTYATVTSITARLSAEKPSAVVCAGDWCNFGIIGYHEQDAFKSLIEAGAGVPLMFCEGNHESSSHIKDLEALGGKYLARRPVIIEGIGFGGIPFFWDENYSDEVLQVQTNNFLHLKSQVERLVLVTHMPPRGYFRGWAPDRREEDALTSHWVRRLLAAVCPDTTITGHLHCGIESHAMTVGGHRVINPGSVGVLIDV